MKYNKFYKSVTYRVSRTGWIKAGIRTNDRCGPALISMRHCTATFPTLTISNCFPPTQIACLYFQNPKPDCFCFRLFRNKLLLGRHGLEKQAQTIRTLWGGLIFFFFFNYISKDQTKYRRKNHEIYQMNTQNNIYYLIFLTFGTVFSI